MEDQAKASRSREAYPEEVWRRGHVLKDLFWRGRLLVLAMSACLGGVLGNLGSSGMPWLLAPPAAFLGAASLSRAGKRAFPWVLLALVCVYAGFLTGWRDQARLEGRRGRTEWVDVEGEVEVGSRGDSAAELSLFRVLGVKGGSLARPGDVYLLHTGEDEGQDLSWGDRVRVEGSLKVFPDARGKVVGSLWADRVERLSGPGNPFLRSAAAIRRRVLRVARMLPGEEAALVSGVFLGDYRRLAFRDQVALRTSGLIHLCAASGLHVGLLAAGILWIMGKFLLSRRTMVVFLIPLLALYVLVAGKSVPVIRASVILAVWGITPFLGRQFDFLPAAGVAVAVLFMRDSNLASSPSFQLSFAAALGVVLLSRPLAEETNAGSSRAGRLLCTSAAAQLAVAPLLLHHFGEFSLLALPANMLVLPALPALMGGFVLSLGLSALSPTAARVSLAPVLLLARWILRVAQFFSAHRWATVRLYPFGPGWMALYYPLLFLALLDAGRRRRLARAVFLAGLSLMLVAGLGSNLTAVAIPDGLQVTFLDVGQGDAALIRTQEGMNVLVDGGKDPRLLERKLRSRGVGRLDAVFLSHPEEDHAGGLPAAFRACSVGLLVIPAGGGEGGRTILDLAAEVGTPVREMRTGDVLQLGGLRITALAPLAGTNGDSSANERSLVVMVDLAGSRFLFTGDVEEVGQADLMERVDLSCDVLKVPHHGGYADTFEEFLKRADPEVAVISVGEDNPYGHPAEATLRCLQRAGSTVYRTDICGDIVIHGDPEGLRVETFGR